MPKVNTSDPGLKMPVGGNAEPPQNLKPAGLEKAPTVAPKVTVETGNSPF
jgi:hypothetical protein